MGYGIHVGAEERTEKNCKCPICRLGDDVYKSYMRRLVKSNMVADMLKATPGIELIAIGAAGFEWFMNNRDKLGVPNNINGIAVLTAARAFAMALMDTAAKIREDKI